MDIAKKLHSMVSPTTNINEHLQYVDDRPFNDFRYCIDSNNLQKLGWEPRTNFDVGLEKTIKWYKTTDIKTYFETNPQI
jgi:dTDP-glucose 4,6-dehydratase